MSTAIINGESRALAIPTPSASGREQLNFTIHIQIEQGIAVVLRSAPATDTLCYALANQAKSTDPLKVNRSTGCRRDRHDPAHSLGWATVRGGVHGG